MYYPDEIVDEVRNRNNIVDVVGSYVSLKKRGANYVGLCPFHGEKTPSFSVNANLQIFKCFGCGKGGNVLTFVMEYESFSFTEALKFLAQRAGVVLPEGEQSDEEKRRRSERETLLEINKEAAKCFYYMLRSPDGSHAYEYLKNRELDDETIHRFGLGYGGKQPDALYRYLKDKGYKDEVLKESGLVTLSEKGAYDKFWNRVIFPIMDINGRVIAFGGRIMGEAKKAPKYLNSPETKVFEKGRNLYGLNIARQSRAEYMLLCEGYMDVIALHRAGFTNAVASLGTALTQYQAKLIARYVKSVVITYDSDGAGVNAALRAIPILKEADISVKILDMKPYKDPDEFIGALGTEKYRERIEGAVNAFYFETEVLRSKADLSDPEEKTRFAHAVAGKLAAITDDIERDSYLAAVSKRYDIDHSNLKKLVNRMGRDAYLSGAGDAQAEKKVKMRRVGAGSEPDDGLKRAQRLLLTCLANEPSLFGLIRGIIGEEDFTQELYQQMMHLMREQYETEKKVNMARIVGCFEGSEEQAAAAGLVSEMELDSMDEPERRMCFADTVVRIKEASLKQKLKEAAENNAAELMLNITKEQRGLPNLHKSLIAGKT